MAKEGFSRAAIEETKYLIQKPRTEVREQKKWGVEFPGHNKVKAAIQRHPAMLRQNQLAGCLLCQYGTAENPQTHWRRKRTGAPPPDRRRERAPEPTPPLPSTPPAPTGNISRVQPSKIVDLAAGYRYLNTALLHVEFVDVEEAEHDTDSDPDMLSDES